MPFSRKRNRRLLVGGFAAVAVSLAMICTVVGIAPDVKLAAVEVGKTPTFVVSDKAAIDNFEVAVVANEAANDLPTAQEPVQQAVQQNEAQADLNQFVAQPNDVVASEPAIIVNEATGQAYAANRVLVTVDASTDADELKAMLAGQGVEATEVELISDSAEEKLIYLVSYNGVQDPASLDGALSSVDQAIAIEPDYIMTLEGVPYEGPEEESSPAGSSQAVVLEADPAFFDSEDATSKAVDPEVAASETSDPNATVNDSYFSQQWENAAVKGTSAWDVIKANGNVTVVVIDSGADANHPDLKNNLILGSYAKNTYTETYGASAINDIVGHGTHVAGIIAAQANNGQGTAGITYNARVLPIKVSFNEKGQMYTNDIIEAIEYVVDLKNDPSSPAYLKNIRVINMSLGGGSRMDSFQTIINTATSAGILVVATAGNNTGYVSEYYPGGYNNVLCVSALKQASSTPGVVFDSSYSNWGPMVDISGPGTRLYAPVPTSSYGYKSGTSMAAPVVSGIAALNFAINMNYKPSEVMGFLQSTAVDVTKTDTGASTGSGFDNRTGYGCVQAYASVNKAKSSLVNMGSVTASSVPDQEYTGSAITPNVTLTYSGKTLVKNTDYTISYSNNVNVGVATITITGKGYYTGTKTITFLITKTSASVRQVTVGKPTAATGLTYNGKQQRGVIDSSSLANLLVTGNNGYGQLGTGSSGASKSLLTLVTMGVVEVAGGSEFSAALTADGSLYTWGNNGYGQLGDGTTVNRSVPTKIMSDVVQVAVGWNHSAALTASGDLYTWGGNSNGQLGRGNTTDSKTPVKVMSGVAAIAAGPSMTAAIKPDGSLYMWGYNAYGQVGDGTTTNRTSPVKVMSNVKQASVSGYHSAVVTTSGDLYAWGLNSDGQLGNGNTTNQKNPVKVASNVKFADAGRVNTIYISAANDLYIAGDGAYGQIGNGATADRTSYLKVLSSVKAADCGYSSVAAVKTDGKLFTWGAGIDGKLGTGSTSNVAVPTAIAAGIESAEFGSTHLLVIEQWPYYFEGTEKATNAGSYTVTAKLRSHAKWSDGTRSNVTLKWKIFGEYDMSGVSFQNKVVTYTGKKQNLAISGTLPSGVSVSYVGNGKTDVGTYTVTAKFSGDTSVYAPIPDKTATLTIQQAQLSSCVGTIPDQIYTGRAVEPKFDLYLGDFLLTEGVHYRVSWYRNNVEIGQAQMRLEGIGNLKGTKDLTFNIVEQPIWMSFPDVVKEVNKAGGPHKVWYVADGWLDYVVEAGLMSGYASNGYFGPYDNITRGQVAVILYRAECAEDPSLIERFGSTTDPAKYAWLCAFRDMDASVYYTAAVNWAKTAGIMTGDAATNYTTVRPNDSVTREELCLMLARYVNGGTVPSVELDPYKSQGILGMNKISSWARDGVYWAVNNGVIGGVDNHDGTYSMDPQGKTWRSAAAKMFTVVTRDILDGSSVEAAAASLTVEESGDMTPLGSE